MIESSGIFFFSYQETVIDEIFFYLTSADSDYYDYDVMMQLSIAVNSSDPPARIGIIIPHEIYGLTCSAACFERPTYDQNKDASTILLDLNSSQSKNEINLFFSWDVKECFSYDRYRVVVPFYNLFAGEKIYSKYFELEGVYFPVIKVIKIQINERMPIDGELTYPKPHFVSHDERGKSYYWIFDDDSDISSVQAVFKDPLKAEYKNRAIFLSGVSLSLGSSLIVASLLAIIHEFISKIQQLFNNSYSFIFKRKK